MEKDPRRHSRNQNGGVDGGGFELCQAGSQEKLGDTFTCVLKESGLRVIVASLPSAGNMSLTMSYRVGVGDEGPGENGAAHLLEHLLFQGTEKFPHLKKEFRRIGATFNGRTSHDATMYRSSFPAAESAVRLVLDIEMDRMRNAQIKTLDLEAERSVVRHEHQSSSGDVHRLLRNMVYDAAYPKHGYGRAGAAIENIDNLDAHVLDKFYRRHYRPDNATLVVAGPVTADDMLNWAAQALRRNPPRAIAMTNSDPDSIAAVPAIAPSRRDSRIVANYPGKQSAIAVFFRSFPATHQDFPALVNLRDVLVTGDDSILQKLLVAPGHAKRVSGAAFPNRDDGGLYIVVDLAPEHDPGAVQKMLLKALRALGSGESPVSLNEAQMARRLAAESLPARKTMSPMLWTGRLAVSESYGDWRFSHALDEARAQVTVDDLNRVAQNVMVPDRQTTVTLLPDPPSPTKAASRAAGSNSKLWIDKFAPRYSSPGDVRMEKTTGLERSKDSIRTITKNFDDCWSMDATVDTEHPRGSVVGVLQVRMATPAANDASDGNLLIIHKLLPDLLFGPGAFGEYGEITLEPVVELGLDDFTISRATGGWFRFSFAGALEDVTTALKLLDAHTQKLDRNAQMIRLITEQHIATHAQNMKQPLLVGLDASVEILDDKYDTDDLRRFVVPNLRASLEALTFEDVQAFSRNIHLTEGHLVIAGNVEPSKLEVFMKSLVDNLSGRLPCKPGITHKPLRLKALSKPVRKHIHIPKASDTAVVVVNGTKPGLQETDLLALDLAGEIMATRFGDRLRQQGLAYNHTAMFSPGIGENGESANGSIRLAAITTPAQANRVAEICREELKTLRERGVSSDEVAGAKSSILALKNLMGHLNYSVSKFAEAYLRGVTREESMQQWRRQRNTTMREGLTAAYVNAALSRYLAENIHHTVMAGKLEK